MLNKAFNFFGDQASGSVSWAICRREANEPEKAGGSGRFPKPRLNQPGDKK
jgi:hypothetical protein